MHNRLVNYIEDFRALEFEGVDIAHRDMQQTRSRACNITFGAYPGDRQAIVNFGKYFRS